MPVGREEELQVLLDALDGASAGRGATAVVLTVYLLGNSTLYGSVLSFRDPDGMALEFFAPPA